ncbi:MAG: sulfite oxidase-like oxidoreductase [Phycisphaerae bacterium]|nr:sulfite oxidase-like oxidoreductase [Phycisphaerae bacterium]MDW8262293.1 sulfite oxidase-like oxidoreductase [Phycisphaerales bacterium]
MSDRPRIISPDTLRGSPEARTPPGQTLTRKWPVLHYGPVPRVDPHSPEWRLRIFGLCDNPCELTYDQLRSLPAVDVFCDIHCVTRWSRLDNTFTGVQTKLLLERARPRPEARFVMCHCEAGFTVNVPLSDFTGEDCLLAWAWEGRELEPEHGWPLRGLVPRLYFWKSGKWIRGIELRATDAPGFWEQNGYHMRGDPWKEERFGW